MPAEITQITTPQNVENPFLSDLNHEEQLLQMEAVQQIANPHLPKPTVVPPLDNVVQPLPNVRIPKEMQKEVFEVVDKIGQYYGFKSVSQRLLEIQQRVGEVTEQHIFQKKEKEHQTKADMKGNVDDQKSWKNYQGGAKSVGGFGTAILSVVGAFVSQWQPQIGEVINGLSKLTPQAADTVVTLIDGQNIPLSHEQQYFLSTVQSDKQAVEGLKRLPEEIRNLVLELVRLELKAIETIGQR